MSVQAIIIGAALLLVVTYGARVTPHTSSPLQPIDNHQPAVIDWIPQRPDAGTSNRRDEPSVFDELKRKTVPPIIWSNNTGTEHSYLDLKDKDVNTSNGKDEILQVPVVTVLEPTDATIVRRNSIDTEPRFVDPKNMLEPRIETPFELESRLDIKSAKIAAEIELQKKNNTNRKYHT